MLKQVANSKRLVCAQVTVASVPAMMVVALPEPVQARAGLIAQEGREQDFRVASSRAPKFPLMYEYKHRIRIGSAGHDDFGHTAGTLAFRPNECSKTVRFETYSDQCKEPDESVSREVTDGQTRCLRHGRRIEPLQKLRRAERVQFQVALKNVPAEGRTDHRQQLRGPKLRLRHHHPLLRQSRVEASCRLAPGLSERQARSRPTGEER